MVILECAPAIATVPQVPVYVVPSERVVHRFFDTSPISPSGRYLALFRLPYADRSPGPGDSGDVVLVDLHTGGERIVERSAGWEMQVGANVQWGASDDELYFNAVDPATWRSFTVQANPFTGARRELDGHVFMVSSDGAWLASHDLVKSRLALPGYGVVVPDELVPRNAGPVRDDGIYVTDTNTGRSRLLVSLQRVYEEAVPSIRVADPTQYEYHCFQVKWNPQGTRLLSSVQWGSPGGGARRRAAITMNADGSDIRTAVSPDQWARGGHHINWHPDGEHISMNLVVDDDHELAIVTMRFDGSGLRKVFTPGSGHPSFHPGGRYIVTDAYPGEPVAFGDGTVPIRLIDTETNTCTTIARVYVSLTQGEFRLDPHPAWDASGRYVVFNGLIDGQRRVFVADLAKLLNGDT